MERAPLLGELEQPALVGLLPGRGAAVRVRAVSEALREAVRAELLLGGGLLGEVYPVALAKADPLTGRRYTRAELKTQFQRKMSDAELNPDDVLRQYYAFIDKVIEEAGIQHVPRFA